MRFHIQGLFVLLGVGIALLVMARIAAPVLDDAFGEDGAIVAESSADDGADLAAEEAIVVPLDGEEVALLQANLTDLGFDPGPVDGILGNGTRSATARRSSSISSMSAPPIAKCSSTPSR